MKEEYIQEKLKKQHSFFATGETLPVKARLLALKKLRKAIQSHEQDIYNALYIDLGKSQSEAYMCEVGMVYSEISYMLSHTKKFAKTKRVPTPLAQWIARSYQKVTPKGVVLIMSPWNYPFMLTIDPLVDAIAAGNTAIIKPSAYAPETAKVLKLIIEEVFDEKYVCVITGGREENQALLKQDFDHIFFTGSKNVGKEVLRQASEHLVSTTLELGGKSPCIVDASCNLKMTAKRIVFGKFLNCGQTCVAPDYILCEDSIYEQFKEACISEIKKQFTEIPLTNDAYGHIINEKHFERLKALINKDQVIYGGDVDEKTRKIEPTLLAPCTFDDEIMQDEIFGPILPIIPYISLKEVLDVVNQRDHPLAFYIFSSDQPTIDYILNQCPFGGGCINDTIIHLATSHMGFGGCKHSGIGSYHGKIGFDTFSHYKSIVDKKTWFDLPMRYQPYSKLYDQIIRIFLR